MAKNTRSTTLPVARVRDARLRAPGEQALANARGTASRSALKAFAQLLELQRASLHLQLRRTVETAQQFQLKQHLAARLGTALDPHRVRDRRRFIGERA